MAKKKGSLAWGRAYIHVVSSVYAPLPLSIVFDFCVELSTISRCSFTAGL